ncbi:hypothetical protein PV326_007927 [Microctonus aethiopoides]|nr:hypothetical protein PV326_007927 [Microctonus aethiopoides]
MCFKLCAITTDRSDKEKWREERDIKRVEGNTRSDETKHKKSKQGEARELREISRYEDGEIIEEAEGAGGEPGTCGVYEASVAEVTKEGIEKDRTLCSVRAEKGEYDNILSEKYNGGHRNASVMEKFELTASSLTCNEWKEEWEQMCEACWDAKELELIEMKKKLRRKWKKDICKTVVSIEKMDKIEKLFEAWEANADSVERQKRLGTEKCKEPKKKKARGGETGEEHIKGVQSVLQSKAMRMGEPEARKSRDEPPKKLNDSELLKELKESELGKKKHLRENDWTWEMRDNMLRIRLKDMADKLDSMRKKGMMRGSDIWIDDDPTHRETQIQKWLRRVADKDTKDKRQAKVTYMKIERNGIWWKWNEREGKLDKFFLRRGSY